MKYPKVLIINSQGFNNLSGPGITLTNLFSGWPRDRIAIIHHDQIPLNNEVCRDSYDLSGGETRWLFPFGVIGRLYIAMNRRSCTTQKEFREVRNRPRCLERLLIKVECLRDKVGIRDIFVRYKMTKKLSAWIFDFNPELIYTQPSNSCFMTLALGVQQLTGASLVTHVMDDWASSYERAGVFERMVKYRSIRLLKDSLKRSSVRIGISKKMAKAYSSRYGCHFIYFHNPSPFGSLGQDRQQDGFAEEPFEVIYSGVISPRTQYASLRDLCSAVQQLSEEGILVSLSIYAPPRLRNLYGHVLESSAVHMKDYVADQGQVNKLYQNSDLLVIPLNYDLDSLAYTSLSMPTKVTSYMASGTPILVYAPRETALAEYANSDGWAIVVTRNDVELLKNEIKRGLVDAAMRKKLMTNQLDVFKRKHDFDETVSFFQDALLNAVRRDQGECLLV